VKCGQGRHDNKGTKQGRHDNKGTKQGRHDNKGTKMTNESERRSRGETEALRRAADLLCLWRLCGNAACRRAHRCRGRAQVCAKHNATLLSRPVREFFAAFLAAKRAGLSFDQFKAAMEQREETHAFFAWRRAAAAPT
jgi:hypothetical protein